MLFLACLMHHPAKAQNLSREQERRLKDALQQAERHIGYEEYRQALPFLETAVSLSPNHAQANFWLGLAQFNVGNKSKAYKYLEKAIQTEAGIDPRLRGLWARALHYKGDLTRAAEQYRAYLGTLRNGDAEHKEITRRLEQVNNARVLMRDTLNVLITNMGPNINSAYPDYVPVLSADEEVLIFTSRRPENMGSLDMDGFKFEDLYISRKTNNQWQRAQNMGAPVNTTGHDASASISADGQTLYIYRDTDRNVYQCRLRGNQWSEPLNLGRRVMSRNAWDEHASQSADGRFLYITTDRPGGHGGLDIWVSERQADGDWGEPRNLGPSVNTPFDERGPFIHVDGATLYFSSEGHNSMGGLDIFKTVRRPGGEWTRPENIGYPVNTPDDDVYFVMSADGKRAYYSSSKEGGLGEKDIYQIVFRSRATDELATQQTLASYQPSANISFAPLPASSVTMVRGVIADEKTGQPLSSNIRIVNTRTNEEVAVLESNSASGKYLATLPAGGQYAIFVEAEGYLFHSAHFDVESNLGYNEVVQDVRLKSIRKGQTIVLRNIFFDHDKYTLRDESEAELKTLINILNDNPNLIISINGHTDSNGDDAYNQRLSENRAKAVVEYLVGHGIAATRLASAGYGETMPIDTNETDAGRQNNRRTEFQIVSL